MVEVAQAEPQRFDPYREVKTKMRCLIIVAGTSPSLPKMLPRLPGALVPCVDRPILQHLIEGLVDRGFTTFDFVLHECAGEIEQFLGDGARWGTRFAFHLTSDPTAPYESMRLLMDDGQPVLLTHLDRMPLLPKQPILEQHRTQGTFIYTDASDESGGLQWTGTAFISYAALRSIPVRATREQVGQVLRQTAGIASGAIDFLSFSDFGALLESQRKILNDADSGTHLAAREIEPGIWLARNVVIHPTAQLTAPIYIGENSRIGYGAQIGPNAAIGHDTIIDKHSHVIDSSVLPGSYCGEHLELDHVIVDRNHLINCKLAAAVNISDAFILSGLRQTKNKQRFMALLSRALAAILLLLTLPIVVLTVLALALARGKSPLHRRRVVKLPALIADLEDQAFELCSFRQPNSRRPISRLGWLLLDFLPALGQVATGKLHLVGVRPLSPEEIRRMPADWRALYLAGRTGLLTEAFVIHGARATEDDIYACEAYYTAVDSVFHDISLAVRFVVGKT